MPVDPLDDIELRSVQLQFPNARGSIIDSCDQRRIPTDKGDILVAVQGDNAKPAILTYHDLGLNCEYSILSDFRVKNAIISLSLLFDFHHCASDRIQRSKISSICF